MPNARNRYKYGLLMMICALPALLFLDGCVSMAKKTNPTAERLLLEGYSCYRVSEPIKMDGHLGDPAWARAPVLNFYKPPRFETAQYPTEARLLYNQDYLFVGFKAYDRDIWGYDTNRDDSVSVEDALEIFFRTDPEDKQYYDFEINALGTVYDALGWRLKNGQYPGGAHYRGRHWNCEHLQVKTGINGTLNDLNDNDQYWTMEVAVPFAELPSLAGKSPRPGDVWSFHLSRCEYSIYMTNRSEMSSCAPLPKLDFHWNENWLKLNFK